MMQIQTIRPYFLLIAILGAGALAAAVFLPFLKPLALAAVFAVVLQGFYQKMSRLLGGWPSTAALLTVVLSVFLVLLPLSLVGVLVGNQARDLYVSLDQVGGRSAVAQMFSRADQEFGGIIPGLSEFSRNASTNIDTYAKDALQWVTGHAGDIFSSISGLLLSLFIFFIALYYLLRDGKRVRQVLIELSPLSDREDEGVFDRLELAINSVIKGNLTLALVQGVLTTAGFTLFGVPNAILWGTVASVAALIPGIGTGLVIIPAVAFLFFAGATVPALGLLIWGALGVGLIDNLLGPRLVGRGINLHPLLVLLSVLGGLSYFGPTGIFLGPLTLSLLFALLSIYSNVSRSA
ncbi:MAG: AI-2E family transporter [Candidatus Pacebacteria bacterium]|nr:AI-2E family transporter [Candidatus Paceibacterota bacterium]